ncbi:family 43 glycosylhydrolase [Pseudokineococcus lusitanus]|uniref:Glycosyl hydrolase family 43 n=1 Tax=Pseudokineococcus lusitanus TaxID=763993 RepID=A0A3N1HSH3_9ACTN|nr:family 43 glycosylhydrolase [Pseudokineococcus lusitanus]ROP45498.1 glycosyl hydrolase family 43 [Pseudokineococcus lusitanus]
MPSPRPLPPVPARRRAPATALAGVLGLGLAAGLLAPVAVAAPAPPAPAAAASSGEVVRYAFDAEGDGGTRLTDTSGHGRDAVVRGGTFTGEGSLRLDGDGDHVDLPDDLLAGLTDITVEAEVLVDPAMSGQYMLWAVGNTTGGVGDGYLFADGDPYRTGLSLGDWSDEQVVQTSSSLARGVWTHLTYTLSDGTAVLYRDGLEVARTEGVTAAPGAIGDGRTTAAYLGRSVYDADPTLRGELREFAVHDRALSAAEVLQASGGTAAVADVTEPSLKVPAVVDTAAGTVLLPVRPGTDRTAMAPELVLADGATSVPPSGSRQDLSGDPVPYVVTGADGATRTWQLRAVEMRSPSLPGLHADPTIMAGDDGRFYLYPTEDGFPGWGSTTFHAYSSTDLVEWTDHGTVLDLGPDVAWADGRAWAPAAVQKDGKTYFYFSADQNIGVAVGDSPAGPFTEPLGRPLVDKADHGGAQQIDPAVFTDVDGQSYLYWGNGRAYVVPLADDMVSYDPAQVREIPGLDGFREGLWMHERQGTYHLTWSIDDTRSEDYRVGYATGPSPTGPWTNRGVVLRKDTSLGLLGTGHHSTVQVPGTDEWLVAYHRFAVPDGDGTNREVTIDHLEHGADGLLRPVRPTLESVTLAEVLGPDPEPEPGDGPEPVVAYDFRLGSGEVVTDASGGGRDARVVGGGARSATDGLVLDGSTYVDLPDDLLRGLDDVTVSTEVLVDPSQRGSYFLWGLGNTRGGVGDGYLFATGDPYRTSITPTNWSGEETVAGEAGPLPRGVWRTLTYTLEDGTARLYLDGDLVGTRTGVATRPGDLGGGRTTANYVGRSLYDADARLIGKVRDFRVYDGALDADAVAELAPDPAERVAADLAALDLGDTSAVTEDLELPASGPAGTTITWASDAPTVVAADGTVTRPAFGQPDAVVTLTATATARGVSAGRTFTVTVPAMPDDATLAAEAAAALAVPDADRVRGNVTLPTTSRGATVAWASSDPAVVTPTGEVTRGDGDVTVTLTATVTYGGATTTRDLDLHVVAAVDVEPFEGYAFAYFTGDSLAGENIFMAASRGNDALRWDELDDGQPVLRSELGTRGLRDPFVVRAPEGDRFFMIATDLSIGSGTSWDDSQRRGSRSINVWESDDLVTWSEQRQVVVSPENAGNTWAPEAFWSEELGSYVVFWASKLYPEDDPQKASAQANRMMYATTRDFRTFTEPAVWQFPGTSVIDTTVIEEDGTYYRFVKDEGSGVTGCTDIIQQRSRDLLAVDLEDGPQTWETQDECIGRDAGLRAVEGPTVFEANEGDVNGPGYHLFLDEYGGRGYLPLRTADLDAPDWEVAESFDLPANPRHGTVVPVTAAELATLRAGLDGEPPAEPEAPGAPTGVTATAADGALDVAWTAPTTGGPVAGYTVTASPGGATCSTDGATTCRVGGLERGTAHTVVVVARGTDGAEDSAPTAASAPATPGWAPGSADGVAASVAATLSCDIRRTTLTASVTNREAGRVGVRVVVRRADGTRVGRPTAVRLAPGTTHEHVVALPRGVDDATATVTVSRWQRDGSVRSTYEVGTTGTGCA